MRKLFTVLVLIVAVACNTAAVAASGDAVLCREDENRVYFNYGFTDGDTFYMASYDGLYTYHVGDADVESFTFEIPGELEGNINCDFSPFAFDGKLYAVLLLSEYAETTDFVGAQLGILNSREEGVLRFEKQVDLDWSDMLQHYGGDTYATRPENPVAEAGRLFFRYYDEQGDYRVGGIELDTGKSIDLSDLRDIMSLSNYTDGKLLMVQTSYSETSVTRLLSFDCHDSSIETLCEMEMSDYSSVSGVTYDSQTGILYCTYAGEIHPIELQSGEIGEGITDMPIEMYGTSNACVLNGGYYACCSDGAAIRNLDPNQRAEIRLKISDSSWSESVNNAYYRFSNTHGDISVVLSRDYAETEKLVEAMMNRDDSVDIYILDSSSSIYDALFNRGYMMELDGSTEVNALEEGMYPAIRDALSPDGHIVALPVELNSFTFGVNEKALEQIGMKLEDVPDNWSDFLDYLSQLSEKIPDGSKVTAFYPGLTDEDARNDLFYTIFDDYQQYINHTDPSVGYNTELLRGLLRKLENVDFTALGCIPAEDYDDEGDYYSEENMTLFELSTSCTIGNFYGDYTPVLMSMDTNTPHMLVLEGQVAFVNPFTKNPDAALAFMDEMVRCLSTGVRYCLDPQLNEPIRGKWNEQYIAELEETLAALVDGLESAPESDRQMIEDSIRDYEENLAYMQIYGWEVSEREIKWYREHDSELVIGGVNWLYTDGSGEGYMLMNQYTDGMISLEEMLEGIDKKVHMMLMEGN